MKSRKAAACCAPAPAAGGFKVEAVVSVDERGQMVLPKDLRDRAGIGPGEKLALISWEKDGQVCCMSLVKTEAFAEMVKGLLGPMMSEMSAK
jgi:AbrB family looped-hinge helix DNA binding protein